MESIQNIQTPAFLVDLNKVKINCDTMRERCDNLGLSLRTQLKTHKTLEGALLMTAGTKRCVTVSTLKEAEFFADAGFDDILFGYCINRTHIARCKKLVERLEAFHVLVDSFDAIDDLAKTQLTNNNKSWSVMIKIDVGTNRAGVFWDSENAVKMAESIEEKSNITLKGLYAFCGGLVYGSDCRSPAEINTASNLATERLLQVKNQIFNKGISFETYGIGCTPTASQPGDKVRELTELHPGSYFFYDLEQTLVGSVTLDRVACRVATRVVGHYPEKNTMLVDCGYLALSVVGKDMAPQGGYCLIEGHPELKMTYLCQEVGTLKAVSGKIDYEKFPVGSLLFIYPYRSCSTAAMHQIYYIHSGDKIVDKWHPVRGW